jgi:hypothetical protein
VGRGQSATRSRGSRHFPQARIILWEGMNECSTLRLPQRRCSRSAPSATITTTTTTAHSASTPPTTPTSYNHTFPRPHHDYLHHISICTRYTACAPKCDARHHDAPTSRSTTSLRSPFNCLAPLPGLTGASQIDISRPPLCISYLESPNLATTSVTVTPGNAPDIISQDRVDECASTG